MILEIVAIVLIILLLLVLAVLLIPFHVILTASVSQSSRVFNVALSWLGVTLWRTKPTAPKEPKKEIKKEEPEKKELGISRIVRILFSLRDSIPALLVLVRSFRRALHVQRLDMNFTFGLGDPADTAILSGYLWSFAWILKFVPSVSFSFRPDFEMVGLDGAIKFEARVRMLFLVIGFLRAYSKKPFRRLIKEVRSR
ncbi:MAG TPA: DUF2953 domain-containing protein [Nitrososphaerales archaeon]|nr:DUF2953 domain-containing protein [Nitrososphaerales archaeon]